jgi:hypothetical protein
MIFSLQISPHDSMTYGYVLMFGVLIAVQV